MNKFFFIIIFLVFIGYSNANGENIKNDIESALNRVQKLKMMEPQKEYTIKVGTTELTGPKEIFLRIRTPQEILSSGFSSGCGDYAIAFYGLISKTKTEILFLDSVELSVSSIINEFSGHTGVSVKDPETEKWILVDPTAGDIISYDWDPSSKIYRTKNGNFWIGYKGKLENYPYKTPKKLREFYKNTIKNIPTDILNSEIIGLKFKIGKTGSSQGESFFNSRIPQFISDYSEIYEKLRITPQKYVRVILSPGSAGCESYCEKSGTAEINCHIGANSAMSGSLFSWIEHKVHNYVKDNESLNYETYIEPKISKDSNINLLPKTFGIKFIEDKNFKNKDGSWINPFYSDFKKRYGSQTGFPVYVYDNGKNDISFCEPKGDVVECFFGRESGLSEGVYSVVINAIYRANKTNKN